MMLRPGDEPIPGYKLQKFLGKGQFGEVWKTTAPGKTNAALKFLDLSGKQGWKEFRGIQHVKRIRHANLMPITALWLLDDNGNVLSDDAIDNMVTDSAAGSITETAVPSATISESVTPRLLVVANLLGEKNLLEVMKEHKEDGKPGIPVDLLLSYMEDAAKGIDFLNSPKHNLGQGRVAVQHCDIKPENILLVGDSVMVCDFGVARVLEAGISATATGMVGSPAYMAPECIEQKPSLASDQYSLALSYAELRQGELPFSDKTYPGVIKAHQTSTFDFSGISESERQVLKKATSKKPADRFETSIDMVRALRRAVEGSDNSKGSSSKAMLITTVAAASIAIGLLAYNMTRPKPNENDNNGNDPPPIVETAIDIELHFSKSIDRIQIDGTWHDVNSKLLSLQRKDDAQIRIELTETDQFEKVDETIAVADFVDGKRVIQIQEKASYYSSESEKFFADGKFDQAVTSLANAITIDHEFARIPDPSLHLEQYAEAQIQIIDSGQKLSVGSMKGEIAIFDLSSNKLSNEPVSLFAFGQSTEALSLSNSHYAFRKSQSEISVHSLRNRASSKSLDSNGDIFELFLSPNGRWLVGRAYEAITTGVEVPDEISPQIWDLSKPSASAESLTEDMEPWTSFFWSPDNRHLVGTVDLDDEDIRIWSFRDDNFDQTFTTGFEEGAVTAVAFSPDSRYVVFAGEGSLGSNIDDTLEATTASGFHRAAIYDSQSKMVESLPDGHNDVIEAVDMSESQVLTGDASGTIQLWKKGSEDWELAGETKQSNIAVSHLKFVNHGRHIISASKTQILIHRSDNLEYSIPIAQDDILLSKLAVSPNDRWIVALDQKGNVFVWDLQRCLLIYEACLQTGETFHFEPRSNDLIDDENISLFNVEAIRVM